MPEPAVRAEAHRHEEPHDHVVPIGTYVLVFLGLMVGTGLTVAASYWDLGIWNTPVAMLIAVTKAGLVVLFFMHLKYSPKLFWLSNLVLGVGADYVARAILNLGNPGT